MVADTDSMNGHVCTCAECGADLKVVCPNGHENADVAYRDEKLRKTRKLKPFPTEKECRRCKQTKPVNLDPKKSAFRLQRVGNGSYPLAKCKQCQADIVRERNKAVQAK